MNKLKQSISYFLCLFTLSVFSQTIIHGKIIDNNNEVLSGTNIIVSNSNNNTIITYAFANDKGNYKLHIKSNLDSLKIEVTYIGFYKQSKIIVNKNQIINFTLKESNETLKEVFVKNIPIKKKGDTLSYNVAVFRDQKDRVIADVLKKMPGIEVLSDGKILYQGVPIQKYYIEGLDLLEGRYNLANNNLPASSVLKVQILENHQPIKLLDSVVFSDKTSLNIKLKNKITTTGSAKIGAGFSPFLWDTNITPMFFGKKKQMISSYQTNNTGNDVSGDLKYLTLEQLLDKLEGDVDKNNWANIQELSPPSFSKKRWLDNNVHLLTSNLLLRLKKDTDLKINLSYINDYQKQYGSSKTIFLTSNENISLFENTENKLFFNKLKSKFILTKNTKNNYYKNTLEINKIWDKKQGLINSNTNIIDQNLSTPSFLIRNKLKWSLPIKNKFLNIKSIISYNNKPENFDIYFNNNNILNNISYNRIKQNLALSSFYTNNALGFTKKIKNTTFHTDIGLKIHKYNLKSDIFLFENSNQNNISKNFFNNLNFNKSSFYGILKTQKKYKNWKININLPLRLLNYNITDNTLFKKQNLNTLNFEPNISVLKQLNTFWKTRLSLNLKNNFGKIDQQHYGYIFTNYRTLQLFDNPISKQKDRNINFNLSYRNPIKSLFINGRYSFRVSNQNLISNISIGSDGISSYGFLEKNNQTKSHNYDFKIDKYVSKLKTNVSLSSNISFIKKNQLLNNSLVNVTNKSILINGEINSEISNWLSINFTSSILNHNTFLESKANEIISQKYLLDLSLYPDKNQYIGINFDYYKITIPSNYNENYFLNFIYRYTFIKNKIDLELNWNNILNTKQFINNSNNSFIFSESVYEVRPSQITASIKFSLEGIF